MRSYDPSDESDRSDAERLGAPRWMLNLVQNVNPSYPYWGPHEDYMIKRGSEGWEAPLSVATWTEFDWGLDDLNECVNFYFAIDRESQECPNCGGNGYHPDAQVVANSFYAHMNPGGEHWNDKITEDEVAALLEAERLTDFTRGKPEGYVPTAEEVNAGNRPGARGFLDHDCINRHILIRARLKRLGLPETCPECEGHGYVFTALDCHLQLVLWMIHPRKGASRGVEVKRVEREDLPEAFRFLRQAAGRNAGRFSGIPAEQEVAS